MTYITSAASAPVVPGISSVPWVRWFKADNMGSALNDGDAVASWANSAAPATAAVQATTANKPVYKTNIINGQPVVRFDGVNDYLRTVAGGASLSGSFYMGVVGRPSQIGTYQHVVCFGEDTAGARRGMLLWGESTNGVLNSLTFNGTSADVRPPKGTPPVVVGTSYLWEVYYDGVLVHIAQNGKLLAILPPNASLVSYSSAAITIGSNNSAGEPFGGDIAEVFLLGSLPTGEQLASIHGYVASKYGLSLGTNTPVSGISGGAASFRKMSDDGQRLVIDMPVQIGIDQPFKTDSLSMTSPRFTALLSVVGALFANAGECGDHVLMGQVSNANVLAICNLKSNGFAAIRFLDFNQVECGAIGWANPGLTPWGSTDGSFYIEAANFTDPTKGGQFRFVQTGAINGGANGPYLRWEWKTNGDCVWYDLSGSAILTIRPSGAVTFAPRSAPSGPTEGAVYYDSSAHKLKVYTGSTWETITSA